MIAIYSNNYYITDLYIGQLKFNDTYQVYHSIDQYQQAAFEQVQRLCKMDQLKVFEKLLRW